MTSHAPAKNLTEVTTIAMTPVSVQPTALIVEPAAPALGLGPDPVPDHAGLA